MNQYSSKKRADVSILVTGFGRFSLGQFLYMHFLGGFTLIISKPNHITILK